jgi:hypothetical protein
VRLTLSRLPLELAVAVVICLTLVDVALGSNWSIDVRRVAGPLRWVLLAALAVLALAWALSRGSRRGSVALVLGAALVGLAGLSALWSVDPRLSVARCVAFGTVLVAAGAIALAARGDRRAARTVLLAVLAGAVAVALAGLAILVVDYGSAVQEATLSTGARYRGLGQSPNTVVMLFAVAMPIAVALGLRAGRNGRIAAGLALALLAGSIVASGSRGALLAGFVASAVPALVHFRTLRARLVVVAVAGAALAVGLALTTIPDPNPNYRKSAVSSTIPCTPNDAQCSLRLEDEIGRPTGFEAPKGRSIFGSSGRLDAWRGALREGAERPGVGFGFGTESKAFTDRYYTFQGGVPENSYIGMFLQLGAVGFLLLVGLAVALLVAAVRAVRTSDSESRGVAAACAAILLVGLGLALFQSYLYAAGNTATLSVWLGAFLVTAFAAKGATS